ncbi:hypothetical protein [uncultured Maribacter sp.]|uniref:hypothetical protein n=1 Tax=uncultured Maribacter sp. TaxID=431308 RepID=UPI00261E9503|nr:hypothetical protein [uncultured Maribacter sp.]
MRTYNYLVVFLMVVLTSCTNTTKQVQNNESNNWKDQLDAQIKLLGHRNWIVVADGAYPLQSNPGITTILSDENHVATIKTVNELIKQQKHIKPILYLDKEIDFVSENSASGINEFRTEINELFGANSNKLIHEDIIKKLDEASKLFNVIIIKTDFDIPYTSLFFQLDCNYWNADSEKELRLKMSENE